MSPPGECAAARVRRDCHSPPPARGAADSGATTRERPSTGGSPCNGRGVRVAGRYDPEGGLSPGQSGDGSPARSSSGTESALVHPWIRRRAVPRRREERRLMARRNPGVYAYSTRSGTRLWRVESSANAVPISKRGFAREKEAADWLACRRSGVLRGYGLVDGRGKTLAEFVEDDWLPRQDARVAQDELRASTAAQYRRDMRTTSSPSWGSGSNRSALSRSSGSATGSPRQALERLRTAASTRSAMRSSSPIGG